MKELLKLNHDKLLTIVKKVKNLELWVVGSINHLAWNPKDIDFVLIGSKESFESIKMDLLELNYPLKYTFSFIDLNYLQKKPRYILKSFFLYNVLIYCSTRLSHDLFNINFVKVPVEEVRFTRFFHYTIALHTYKLTKSYPVDEKSLNIHLRGFLLKNAKYSTTKKDILGNSQNPFDKKEIVSFESYFRYGQRYCNELTQYQINPLLLEEIDFETIHAIKKNFPEWIKNRGCINKNVIKFLKKFYKR